MKCIWNVEERKQLWETIDCPYLKSFAETMSEDQLARFGQAMGQVCDLCLKARLVNVLARIEENGLTVHTNPRAE